MLRRGAKLLLAVLALTLPSAVAGRQLGPVAEGLRQSLECVSESESFVFGHQLTNTAGRALAPQYPPLTPLHDHGHGFVDCLAALHETGAQAWPGCQPAHGALSDVRNATGKFPGLFGFDWQWAVSTANADHATPAGPPPVRVPTNFSFNPFIYQARAAGALVTIDMHFSSPLTLVHGDSTGSPITELLPHGKANAMWTAWLDSLAEQVLADPNNAFILRPFHEMTLGIDSPGHDGGWWWAAGAGVTPAQYRAAYNYTRWYVEEVRGVRNVLWAYAPANPSQHGDAAFSVAPSSYYPGDENVDVVCFDHYGKGDFSAALLADCAAAVDFAAARGKIPAICETGVSGGVQNTELADWFTKALLDPITADQKCARIAYALTWSQGPLFRAPAQQRANDNAYWTPVQGDPTFADFQTFAADERTLFAGELGTCGAQVHAGCADDRDCSLLGVCLPTGICRCDRGWTGVDCAAAKLGPLNTTLGYSNATAASWGGSPIHHQRPSPGANGSDGNGEVWSYFGSQFTHNCPLAYWLRNSIIVRAESTMGIGGPYQFVEQLYPEFHHSPRVVGPTQDGYYVMFMIGATNASNVVDCTTNPRPVPVTGGNNAAIGTISMAWSLAPSGPWSAPRAILRNWDKPTQNQSAWDCYVTTPSPVLYPNGSVLLVFDGVPCDHFSEAIGRAFAPHWNSTYLQSATPIYIKPTKSPEGGTELALGNVEDLFTWIDARGNYHIVAHSQSNTNICGGGYIGGESHSGPGNACGVHLFASEPAGEWRHSRSPAYSGAMAFVNGSAGYMHTRQRAVIVFDADGTTPRYLINAGSFDEYNQGTVSINERAFFFEFIE